jgi:drug/metabolite transporter (DMT)-like permease
MRNYIYMILAAMCLGTLGVLVKLIGENMPVMTISFFRVALAFIFLLLIVPFLDKKMFKISKKDIKGYVFLGFLYALSLAIYPVALWYAPIQNVVLIGASYPFFVLIFAYFLLKEQITTTKLITLFVAIFGLIIINPFKSGSYMLGNTISLISAIIFAILITEMRKENKNHSIGDVFWFFLFATLFLLPFPIYYGLGNLSSVWQYVLLLGFVSTGLVYLLYNLALEKIEAEIASIITTIISPIISIGLAVLIINEQINNRIIIGGALLIIAGIYLEMHNRNLKNT